ncbi:MAG: hypothetical protein Q8J96_00595 [Rhodocyclaceae bacterium]|nr:hypothetical protein [Rhodocyclaceae bacterium]
MQIITLHAAAPEKPVCGAPCNGCGACCAAAPCPVSRLFLGHRGGSCPALSWRTNDQRYVCGMVIDPARHLRWLPRRLAPFGSRAFRRWIAAGTGCDFAAEISE